jgi:hypothetical protein
MQTVSLSKKVPEYQAKRRQWLMLIDPVHLTSGFLQHLMHMLLKKFFDYMEPYGYNIAQNVQLVVFVVSELNRHKV